MNEAQMARAAEFLQRLNDAARETGIHFEDVGGYDKQLTLVATGEKFGLLGSNSHLRWVEDHYEIEAY